MAEIELGRVAYCKLILHAAKYPHCAVNGVLLADRARSKDGKDGKSLKVVDSVPLFHLCLNLSPMMEVALAQVDSYCKSRGLVIAGYYQANENYEDAEPTLIARKTADRIHEHLNEACLLMINNKQLSRECTEEAYKIYVQQEGKWKHKDVRESLEKGSQMAASSLLKANKYRELIDFDNHLDDVSLDWRNSGINEMLRHSTT